MLRGQPRGPGLYHIPPSPLLFRRRRTIRCEKPSSVMSRDQPWRRGCGLSRPQAGGRSPAGDQVRVAPGRAAGQGGHVSGAATAACWIGFGPLVRTHPGEKAMNASAMFCSRFSARRIPATGEAQATTAPAPGPAQKQRQSGRPAPCRYVTQMAPFARPLRGLCLDIARLLPGRSPGPDFRTVGRHAETAL